MLGDRAFSVASPTLRNILLLNIRHETYILKFKKDKDFLGKDINLAQSVKDLGDVCMYVCHYNVDCNILTAYFYSLAGDDFD